MGDRSPLRSAPGEGLTRESADADAVGCPQNDWSTWTQRINRYSSRTKVRRTALGQQGDHTAAAHEWAARATP
jgi:hypothetical protein